MNALSISVVSHGHINEVDSLLSLLSHTSSKYIRRAWVTINVPEPQVFRNDFPFEVRFIFNPFPMGFGANHNQAFKHEMVEPEPSAFFGILNPDIQWSEDPFGPMLEVMQSSRWAFVCPRQFSEEGRMQDHLRVLPTPKALFKRYFFPSPSVPDAPDWANAACMVFQSSAFTSVGGFDESFHMYCEDVDLCLRLNLAGFDWAELESAKVIHLAQRNSRRNIRHMYWHIKSLWHLWRSAPYQAYRHQRPRFSNIHRLP